MTSVEMLYDLVTQSLRKAVKELVFTKRIDVFESLKILMLEFCFAVEWPFQISVSKQMEN
jgi:hypothetical protein